MNNSTTKKNVWYAGGLCFQCLQCGQCCSGPGEGYIWATRPEIELIAGYLKMSVGELRRKYLRRVGMRTSIIEEPTTKDCIFLERTAEGKKCRIYPVRPTQCRTWPFWSRNLASTNSWNEAAQRCAGMNRGRRYNFDEIEKLRKTKKWWGKSDGTD